MTLAVIVGLWGLLSPGLIARESPVSKPIELQATAQTQETPSSGQPEPQTAPVQPDTATHKPEAASPSQAPPKPKRHTHKKKPAAQPNDPPEKVVVRNGSTSEPDVKLSPPMSPNQSSNQLKKTDDLLAGTEENLKKITGRTLNPTQQETVKQVQQYMDQARKAVSDGDLDRGRNLAFKAHLLSDDLVKH